MEDNQESHQDENRKLQETKQVNKLPLDQKYTKERLYDKIPFNKKQMDIIVIVLIVMCIVAMVIGFLKGNN